MRRTKIVCTLGPASRTRSTIAAMLGAGMDVARLNTSHGTLAGHIESLHLVRDLAQRESRAVAVLMDLGGAKLRLVLPPGQEHVTLHAGTELELGGEPSSVGDGMLGLDYPRLTQDVQVGHHVLIDDGRLNLEVCDVRGSGLRCLVIRGGTTRANAGVSLPESRLLTPVLTPHDRDAIAAGVAAGVDYFGLSFVQAPSDITEARECIAAYGGSTPVIAKIERRAAIENLYEILEAADGAMVARGDLGVEIALERVPAQQRRIIEAAGRRMIPVITATEMLESMVSASRPTRAEASDVANAVWDLSDALMLSGETAIGKYPVEAVAMMDRIICSAEEASPRDAAPAFNANVADDSHTIALAVRGIAESGGHRRAIVCFTRSGYTASLLSTAHPRGPIFAITPSDAVRCRLALVRSVIPILGPMVESTDEMLRLVDRVLVDGRYVAAGEPVIVVASLPVDVAGTTNFLKLHRVGTSPGS